MTAVVVVPCFNESGRLDADAFAGLAASLDGLVFVDDGSTDDTAAVLDRLVARIGDRGRVVRLPANAGKAEAVRAGLQTAIDGGAEVVGYFDADLATPPTELLRLAERIESDPELQAVLASRVALLGHDIERHAARHYLGRLYATAASVALGIGVYDTQCGAKLFRAGPALRAAVVEPFPERWSFDVELLARLLYPAGDVEPVTADQIVEVPLRAWRDVAGSKLRPASAARSLGALPGVRRRIRARRAART